MFKNRVDAAKQLLPYLQAFKNQENTLILAIPRGALELGAILRNELNLPLDIVVTKKIGTPGNEEFGIGWVAPDGKWQAETSLLNIYGIPKNYVENEIKRLQQEIKHRYETYRGTKELPKVGGKTILLIDDGIATGRTCLAAIEYLKTQNVKKIILITPVGSPDTMKKLENKVDQVICLEKPNNFYAVAQFYQTFEQVSDQEAIGFLREG